MIRRKFTVTKKMSRHEMDIEIKMLECERDRAIWERDRLAQTVEDLMDEMRNAIAWSMEALTCAEEIVEDQFSRERD